MMIVKKLFWKISTFPINLFAKEKTRVLFGRGGDCLQTVPEYRGKNCYYPVGSNRCFVDIFQNLMDLKYMVKNLGFITQGQGNQEKAPAKIQAFSNIADINCIRYSMENKFHLHV